MLVLGIETTCDETGCAVVREGREILSNVVFSQEKVHSQFGGVVPELACRRHLEVISLVLHKALSDASVTRNEIDLIAVANGPGLIGALLIGVNFAKALSLALEKPLVGVNHVEAHLYAALMENTPSFPSLGVVLSGGHTSMVLIENDQSFRLIGQTQDDAIGESFDKVAKLLNLPYPGGPEIEKLAKGGNSSRYPFKCGNVKNRPLDFSFSGLKTAVFYLIKGQNGQKEVPSFLSEENKRDIAASFQYAAFSDVVKKITLAAKQYGCKSILLGGGVCQNQYFRGLLKKNAPCPQFWPPKGLCLDNGAMIAGLGLHQFLKTGPHSRNFDAQPRISFSKEGFSHDTCTFAFAPMPSSSI